MSDPIRTRLVELFNREVFSDDLFAVDRDIDDSDELIADLGLDSAAFALAAVACADEFGVTPHREEFMNCVTFGALVGLVRAAVEGEPVSVGRNGEPG